MRKILFPILLLAFLALPARAQFLGQTSPQTVTQEVLNTVTGPVIGPAWDTTKLICAPAVGAACAIQNLGQNYHILSYQVTGGTPEFQLRLEYSDDGVTFNPLTDDATSQTSGAIYGQGYHAVIRVNLVAFSGTGSITAFYSGTSTGTMQPTGTLNQSQQYKKTLASMVPVAGSSQTYSLNPPCNSTGGLLWFQFNAGALGGAAFSVYSGSDGLTLFPNPLQYTLANSASVQAFPIPAEPGTFIQVVFSGTTGSTYSAQYDFNCPGGQGGYGLGAPQVAGLLQPDSFGSVSDNGEFTNTASATVHTISGFPGQRVSIFSLNAHCSAGTSSITVSDGGTQIWSTGAADVTTTNFKFQWSPGLAIKIGNGAVITLASCGAGNTGTLDVQASVN